MAQLQCAETITKSSKSNLALALIALPRDLRRDMTTFYAFCRIVDDIADEPHIPVEKRRTALDQWKKALETEFAGEPALSADVRRLIAKHRIPVVHFQEIIAGVEMDLCGARYQTFGDLRIYCHRVASAVGLVSIEIFGYSDDACKKYAVNLGMALQLTNIIRDVGEDWRNGGRVYLPLEDMERFHYSIDDLSALKQNDAFRELMRFEAGRAYEFYALAARELPRADAGRMVAAEIMHRIYRKLLDRIERDNFRVLEKRYSLGKLGKGLVIARTLVGNLLNRR